MAEFDLNKILNAEKANKNLERGIKILMDYDKALEEVVETAKKGKDTTEQDNKAKDKQKKVLSELEKLEKQRRQTIERINVVTSKQNQELQRSRISLQNQQKQIRDNIKANDQLRGAQERLRDIERGNINVRKLSRNQIAQLAKDYTTLANNVASGSKEQRMYSASARALNLELEKLQAAQGRATLSVGKYSKAVAGLAGQLVGALGIVGGVQLFVSALRTSFNVVVEFDQAQARLAGTLGVSRKEIDRLTRSAIRYGSSTKFTAAEVSGLQTELSKLGFTQTEILGLTESVLNLAQATESDLGDAAKVAGIAQRVFNTDIADSEQLMGELAVATTKSALSFSDYETILSTVGPVSNAFNFSLSDTLALTGKLRDAGFDASSAATATRNILLNLADANGDLAKSLGGSVSSLDQLVPALKTLSSSGINLAKTLELTDQRSVSAFNTFLRGSGDILKLRNNIEDAAGELSNLVDIRTDSLRGDIERLKSSTEGFILSVENGNGVFSRFIRDAIQGATNLVDTLKQLNTDPVDAIIEATEGIDDLKKVNADARVEIVRLKKEIEQGIKPGLFETATEAIGRVRRELELNQRIAARSREEIQLLLKDIEEQERRKIEARIEAQIDIDIEKIEKDAEEAANRALGSVFGQLSQFANNALDTTLFNEEEIKEQAGIFAGIFDEIILDVEKAAQQQIDTLTASLKNSEITLEEFYKRQEEIIQGSNTEVLNLTVSRLQAEISELEDGSEEKLELERELLDSLAELREQEIAEIDKNEEKKRAAYQKTADAIKAISSQSLNAIKSFSEASTQLRIGSIDAELQALEAKGKTEAGLTDAEEKRQQDLAKEKARIQREQAKLNKITALFNIAVSTAEAIAQAAPVIPLQIAIGVAGAAQAAAVAAQPLPPIPAFANGTNKAPAGPKVMGEEGREALEDQRGNLIAFTADKATLYNDAGGYRVLNAKKTEEKYNLKDPYSKSNNDYLRKISKKKTVNKIINRNYNYARGL